MIWLLACQEPEPEPLRPSGADWAAEAQLVVRGLDEVEALWKQNQREAARVLASQVYSERWEPKLERAAMAMDATAARETEYAFGLLLVELERKGGRDKVSERIRVLDERVEAVALAARTAFPEGGGTATAPVAAPTPIVPPVAPAWEIGE